MLVSTSRLETPNASKYMQSMCKHFAHKVAVEYDDTRAHADLPPGRAQFNADESGLHIEVTGADDEGLTKAKGIVESHLLRFAFREDPQPLIWSAP